MAYVPPFKRQQMAMEAAAKEAAEPVAEETGAAPSRALQEEMWDALRRAITGAVNKVSALNMEGVCIEAFRENLVRGRGIFCKAIMKAQAADEEMTPVFACLVAVINKEIPELGELLLKRLVTQWKRLHRRKESRGAIAVCRFLSQLVIQRIQDEMILMKILATYLCGGKTTDDDISVVAATIKDSYKFLEQENPKAFNMVLDPMRDLLRRNELTLRGTAIVESLLNDIREWQKKKETIPVLPAELDLVDEAEQHTHDVDLDGAPYNLESNLDHFAFDAEFDAHEEEYDAIRLRVLGEELANAAMGLVDEEEMQLADAGEGEGDEGPYDDSGALIPHDGEGGVAPSGGGRGSVLSDDEVLKLRKSMFLIMKNSMRAEEVVHKFFKHIPELRGNEDVAAGLLMEACYRERIFNRFHPLIAARMCSINPRYQQEFASLFTETYINKVEDLSERDIEKIGTFYAMLLKADAIPWSIFAVIQLGEETTTASQRILLKSLFQGLADGIGASKLSMRLNDRKLEAYTEGLFPKDEPHKTRWAVNFFEEVNVGALGDPLRAWYEDRRKRPRADDD